LKFKRIKLGDEAHLAVEHNQRWYRIDLLPGLCLGQATLLDLLRDWPEWKPKFQSALASADLPGAEISSDSPACLPFIPLSLRDFMLSETHAVNAARGFVKHFMAKVLPVIKAFEGVTKAPFPALKPKAIWYRQPIYYFSNHLNMATEGDPIHWPSYTGYLDYELELAFVLVKPLFNATPEQAMDAIGGFMVLNDFSARDVQLEEMRSGFGPQKSKHFINAMSDTVVTADEVLPCVNNLQAEVRINCHTVSHSTTADFQHSIVDILIHASKDEKLHPGEVFATGTLPNGCAMENDHWLKPGDTIELWIERVGSLSNTINSPTKDGKA